MANVVIIGSGPAGVSAALYTARAGIDTTVLTRGSGALARAEGIENYYGVPGPVSGAELERRGIEGARAVGVKFVEAEAVGLTFTDKLTVETLAGDWPADAVILATGAARTAPPLPGLRELEGRGVICGGQFTLSYPTGTCSLESTQAQVTGAANTNTPGTVTFSWADVAPVTGSQALLRLTFQVNEVTDIPLTLHVASLLTGDGVPVTDVDIRSGKLLPADILRLHIADIRFFHADDPWILSKLPVQLSSAHIDGIHLSGAVLQHAVRKSAGRRTYVRTDLSFYADVKMFQSLFQLQTASADIGKRMPSYFNLHFLRKCCACFIFSDIMIAFAFSLDAARFRLTSNTSNRSFMFSPVFSRWFSQSFLLRNLHQCLPLSGGSIHFRVQYTRQEAR